jgi:polyphosphate kinase
MQYCVLNKELVPALSKEGINFIRRNHWTDAQKKWVKDFFTNEIFPVLSPVGLDPSHPFPPVINKSLNFIVSLEGLDAFGRDTDHAIVTAPRSLPRVIHFPAEVAGGDTDLVFLSSILHKHVDSLFPGMEVTGCYQFRVTRNSNLFVDEEESNDLMDALEGELPTRNFGDSVRLEVADNCSDELVNLLQDKFLLNDDDLYRVNGPVNLNRLIAVPAMIDRPELKYRKFTPGNVFEVPVSDSFFRVLKPSKKTRTKQSMFDAIRKKDLLLHHPYQSFVPVIDFVREASKDPKVLSIKQTLYRTDRDSEIVQALINAALAGKDVTVVVELKARFDEDANIKVANRMLQAGVQVVYGVVGHKTHAKMVLVVRKEEDGLRNYTHLGTGNYHAGTARTYTDFGILSAHPEIAEDVQRIFLQLTGLGRFSGLNKILQAPFTLHEGIIEKINREAENARQGKPAAIIAKMNSLQEFNVMKALYEASMAGVSIDLIIRGICGIRPGIRGLSENIRVRSIVGRFLEHHRIFCFENDGNRELYISSADWLDRNFFRRVETCTPIEDEELKSLVYRHGLEVYLKDNINAWQLDEDGSYSRVVPAKGEEGFSAQQYLLESLGNL